MVCSGVKHFLSTLFCSDHFIGQASSYVAWCSFGQRVNSLQDSGYDEQIAPCHASYFSSEIAQEMFAKTAVL